MESSQFLDLFYSLSLWFAKVTKLETEFGISQKSNEGFLSLRTKDAVDRFFAVTLNGFHFCRLLFVLNPISIKLSSANATAKDVFRTRNNWGCFRSSCVSFYQLNENYLLDFNDIEKKNIVKIIECLVDLSEVCFKNNMTTIEVAKISRKATTEDVAFAAELLSLFPPRKISRRAPLQIGVKSPQNSPKPGRLVQRQTSSLALAKEQKNEMQKSKSTLTHKIEYESIKVSGKPTNNDEFVQIQNGNQRVFAIPKSTSGILERPKVDSPKKKEAEVKSPKTDIRKSEVLEVKKSPKSDIRKSEVLEVKKSPKIEPSEVIEVKESSPKGRRKKTRNHKALDDIQTADVQEGFRITPRTKERKRSSYHSIAAMNVFQVRGTNKDSKKERKEKEKEERKEKKEKERERKKEKEKKKEKKDEPLFTIILPTVLSDNQIAQTEPNEPKKDVAVFNVNKFNPKKYDLKSIILIQRYVRRFLKRLKVFKMKDHRWHVVNEIYNSEVDYIGYIRQLVDQYYQPLVQLIKENKPIIPMETIKKIFCGIEVIVKLNETMLSELEPIVKHWNFQKAVANVFIKFGKFMRMYDQYCNNYDKALLVVTELQKNSEWVSFCRKRFDNSEASSNAKKQSLESLLIMPIQRIPRYCLLLGELAKVTPTYHHDYENTLVAKKLFEETGHYVNDKRTEDMSVMNVRKLDNVLFGNKIQLQSDPARRFVDLVNVQIKRKSSMKNRSIVLFNDLLLLTDVIENVNSLKDDKIYAYEQWCIETTTFVCSSMSNQFLMRLHDPTDLKLSSMSTKKNKYFTTRGKPITNANAKTDPKSDPKSDTNANSATNSVSLSTLNPNEPLHPVETLIYFTAQEERDKLSDLIESLKLQIDKRLKIRSLTLTNESSPNTL